MRMINGCLLRVCWGVFIAQACLGGKFVGIVMMQACHGQNTKQGMDHQCASLRRKRLSLGIHCVSLPAAVGRFGWWLCRFRRKGEISGCLLCEFVWICLVLSCQCAVYYGTEGWVGSV